MATAESQLDPFDEFLVTLSQNISDKELKSLKVLSNSAIGKAKSTECDIVIELLQQLKESGTIARDKTSFLQSSFKAIRRPDLVTKVRDFERKDTDEYKAEQQKRDTLRTTLQHIKEHDLSDLTDEDLNLLLRGLNVKDLPAGQSFVIDDEKETVPVEDYLDFKFLEGLMKTAKDINQKSLGVLKKEVVKEAPTLVGKLDNVPNTEVLLVYLNLNGWLTRDNIEVLRKPLTTMRKDKLIKHLVYENPDVNAQGKSIPKGYGKNFVSKAADLIQYYRKTSKVINKITPDQCAAFVRLVKEKMGVNEEISKEKRCLGDWFLFMYIKEEMDASNTKTIEELLIQIGCSGLAKELDPQLKRFDKIETRLYCCTVGRLTPKYVMACIKDLCSCIGLELCDRRAILFCNRLMEKNEKVWYNAKVTVYGSKVTVTFISGNGDKEFHIALDEDQNPVCTMANYDADKVTHIVRHSDHITRGEMDIILSNYKNLLTGADRACLEFCIGLISKISKEFGKEVLKDARIDVIGKDVRVAFVAGKERNVFEIYLDKYNKPKYEIRETTFKYKIKKSFFDFFTIMGLYSSIDAITKA